MPKLLLLLTLTVFSTNDEDRDQHLKSDDFFNAEEYPQLKFESSNLEKVGKGEYKVTGDLAIRDITNEIELDVVHGGTETSVNSSEQN